MQGLNGNTHLPVNGAPGITPTLMLQQRISLMIQQMLSPLLSILAMLAPPSSIPVQLLLMMMKLLSRLQRRPVLLI
jgi:hypothetical protein